MFNQNTSIRRIVAGYNQLERAVVLMDGAVLNQKAFKVISTGSGVVRN